MEAHNKALRRRTREWRKGGGKQSGLRRRLQKEKDQKGRKTFAQTLGRKRLTRTCPHCCPGGGEGGGGGGGGDIGREKNGFLMSGVIRLVNPIGKEIQGTKEKRKGFGQVLR